MKNYYRKMKCKIKKFASLSSLKKVLSQVLILTILWQMVIPPSFAWTNPSKNNYKSNTTNTKGAETRAENNSFNPLPETSSKEAKESKESKEPSLVQPKTPKFIFRNNKPTKIPYLAPAFQGINDAAVVRHAPGFNSGRVEGNVRVLLGEGANLNSGLVITGDLLVAGTPNLNINGSITYNGTTVGTGNSSPSGYSININNGVSLRHVVTRTDPITVNNVPLPPSPTGTRNVSLNPGQSPGDFSTIRDLTLNSNYGSLTIPQGTYGNFIANSGCTFILGVVGQNTVYNLQGLTLNSNTQIQILGGVTLNLKSVVNLNSPSTIGNPASPASFSLNIATGGLNLNSNTNIYGAVSLPQGTANINNGALIQGQLICDRLNLNGGTIKRFVADTTPPSVTITQPTNNATLTQSQVIVTGTFDDDSVVTIIKVNGVTATRNGNTYTATIPLTLGSNTITAIATDIFGNNGNSSITVTRSDGTNQVPNVNAGTDQTITLPSTASLTATATDDGLPNPPATLTYSWTKVSGAGTVTFSNPTSLTTTTTFSAAGTYVLRMTVSDSTLSASDDVQITVNPQAPQNVAPSVNAGNDQTITLPNTASLTATATDDGLPNPPATLTYNWSKVSGTGNVTFSNPTSLTTTATFSTTGTYTLRLTASDSSLSSNDDLVVTVNPQTPQNIAPAVNAGQDQTITIPSNVTLNGSVTDDGLPSGASLSISWTKVSGTGNVTFTSPNTAITQASFSVAGTYTLRLSASDTELTGMDDVVITVNAPQNAAPVVNAGQDQTITLPNTASLTATASDDGLPNPPASLTYSWSKVSGDGTVTFSAPNALTTTVTFSVAGTYILRLTASDSVLSSSNDVQIIVNPQAPQNQAPTVNVGNDQTITLPNTASLTATASDDGLPNPPSTLTYSWSKVSGSGNVTFSAPNALTTTVTFSVAGTYVLRLTASDSVLSVSDDLQILVNAQNTVPIVNAGVDQTLTVPYGPNLILNSGNEGQIINSAPQHWTNISFYSDWTKPQAGTSPYPSAVEGSSFFFAPRISFIIQDINVSIYNQSISSGNQKFVFNSFLRAGQGTSSSKAEVFYLSSTGNVLASYSTGDVSPSDWTGFTNITTAPVGTTTIRIKITSDSGFIDALSLRALLGTSDLPSASLSGTVLEGSTPVDERFNIQWTKVSGLGNVIFSSPTSVNSTATFTQPGTYSLRLTASDLTYSLSDELIVIVKNVDNLSNVLINAGVDQTLTVPYGPNLILNSGNEGQIINSAPQHWTNISFYSDWTKPQAGTSPYPSAVEGSSFFFAPRISFIIQDINVSIYNQSISSGNQKFVFNSSLRAGQGTSSSKAEVFYLSSTGNVLASYSTGDVSPSDWTGFTNITTAPVGTTTIRIKITSDSGYIDALSLRALLGSGNLATTTLSGSLLENATPVDNKFYIQWTKVSGSGSVIFSQPNKVNTSVTFTELGSYVLKLTASDLGVSFTDEISIVIKNVDNTNNITINAGQDQNLNAPLGSNLILNPGNEGQVINSVPQHWTNISFYSDWMKPQAAIPPYPPAVEGTSFFLAGSAAIIQDIDVFAYNQSISSGNQKFVFNSFVRSAQANSSSKVEVFYLSSTGTTLASYSTGDVSPSDWTNFYNVTTAPIGTTTIRVKISCNGAYVDALSLRALLSQNLPSTTLSGSVLENSLPVDDRLYIQWTKLSGPGSVIFSSPNTINTSASFTNAGTYTLQLTASDLNFSLSDILTLTVTPIDTSEENLPPSVNAGNDKTTNFPNPVNLTATVADDGLPTGSSLTFTWSKVSGNGTVTFSSPNSLSTNASFSVAGSYVLRISATDSVYSVSDEITVNVIPFAAIAYESTSYRYKIVSQGSLQGFETLNYDDSGFSVGDAPFGTPYVCPVPQPKTPWNINTDILLRRWFTLPSSATNVRVTVAIDNDVQIFINGIDISGGVRPHEGCAQQNSFILSVPPQILNSGVNLLAVRGRDRGSECYLDVSIISDITSLSNSAPIVDVGFDRTITLPSSLSVNAIAVDDSFPTGSTLTLAWSKVSGAGNVSFSSPNTTNTSISFSSPGTYTLRLTATDSEFLNSDDLVVIVNPVPAQNQSPQVNAGTDQTINLPNTASLIGTATDDGLPSPPSTLTYSWSKVSGSGNVTFSNSTSLTTTTSFSSAGTYVLRLTVSDSELSANDDVQITVNSQTPQNLAPQVNAGADQTVTLPATATLSATATDDGLPNPPSTLTYTWTKVSGLGTVTFSSPNSLTTTASFTDSGTYTLRFSATDSLLSATDDVVITVNAQGQANTAPQVNSGTNQTILLEGNLVQNSSNELALVNNLIPNWDVVSGSWTQANAGNNSLPPSYEGNTYFYPHTNASAELKQDIDLSNFASTIANQNQQFAFRALVRTGNENPSDSPRIVIEYRNASNTILASLDTGDLPLTTEWTEVTDQRLAPLGTTSLRIRLIATRNSGTTLDAYFDSISFRPVGNAATKLQGTATDDGQPTGSILSINWTKVSGPGTVNFSSPNQVTTGAVFSSTGTYVIRLSASDSLLTTTSDVTITVNSSNLTPVVNAGQDQTITLPSTASLSGNVSDDGLPFGSSLSFSWTKVSGTGNVTFSNPTSLTTTATFSTSGTYVLRLSASDTSLTSTDDITIVVNPAPVQNQAPQVNAGTDQTITLPSTASLVATATDDGLPTPPSTLTYSWTKVSGTGNVTFSNPTSLTTTATFSTSGTYILRFTASDSSLSSTDDVQITVNPQGQQNLAPVVSAGQDQTISISSIATLTATATDDGLPNGSSLFYLWEKVSGPGTVGFNAPNSLQTQAQFSAEGVYILRFSASDSQLTGSDEVQITVITPTVAEPIVTIHSPTDGSTITKPTDVIATITYTGASISWVLDYSLNANDDLDSTRTYTTIATGNTTATNSTIAQIDPTLMLNGNYLIRLTATDNFGRSVNTAISVILDKNLKVGNFTLSFTDAAVPVAGIPITVIRTYDSRDKRKGDFGIGWTLDVKNVRLEKSSNLGKNWIETIDQEGIVFRYRVLQTRSKFVTITFPDGKVFKFKAKPSPETQVNVPVTELNEVGMLFVAEPGTFGTLVPTDDQGQDLEVQGNIPNTDQVPGSGQVQIINKLGATPGLPYNPTRFKLTTLEGAEFIIDEFAGLISIKDLNDNTLTVNNNGLVHSSGKSITFTRDAQGRITQITDPNGNITSYTYNAVGDLVSVTNAENNTTSFTYNSNHYLLDITDARGIKAITNNYDSEGRLIQQIDSFSKITALEHSISAQREIIRDRLGNPTIIDYDDRGNITRNIDALGAQTTYTYDENDNLLTETNALGKTSTYTYDQFSNRLTEKDSLGNTTTYTYNNRQQILTITDPRGAITTNTYDLRGRLSTTKDALNNITQYTYNPGGLITAKTDVFGKVTNFEYNNFGLTTKITDPIGGQTTYTYDENGNPLTETSRRTINGNTELITTSHTYDKLNRLTRTTDADGNFTIREYNQIDMVSRTTDQNNNATTYIYDNRGQLSSITFADGKVQNSTYDVEGRRLTHTDRAGKVTRFTYDSVGRLIETLYPDQTKTIQTYDLIGRVLSSTDALNNTSSYEYDPNCGCSGRLTKVIDATGNATQFAYDVVGNQISVTDANNHTTFYDYDLLNRNIAVRYFDNTQSTTQYDALGRRITQTDQNGKITRFQYDDVGRLVKVIDVLNHETSFTYNELDQMLTQTDALGRTTRYEYNKLGNRTKRILPLGQQETYSYDAVGNLIEHIDFAGQVTTFAYNNLNQLIRREQPNGRRFTYTYTPMGQRSFIQDESVADNTGVITYTYNQTDRLTSKQTPNGTLTYTYDAVGNLLTVQSSNTEGLRVNYGYDSHNRLRTVMDLNLNTSITSYDYDLVGNLSKTTLPNGIESQYQYNALNFLTSINTKKDTTSLLSFTYMLGAIGERLSVSELNGRTVQYNYDAIYRLTSESISNSSNQSNNGVANYNYDLVGNRLQRNSTIGTIPTQQFNYDNNDRLTSDTYDSNGNTIQSNNRSYAYNPDNKLVDVNDTNTNLNIHIVYDADGNRFEKRVTQNNQTIVTKYLVDDISLTGYPQVVEEIVNNQVQRQYTYGLNLISQRQLINNERVSHFFLKDGHNSVRVLTDINGNITDTYEYDAFGNTITSTGNTPNNYLYAGEEWDPDLGMFFLRARYMTPKTGRFITGDYIEGNQEDPLSLHRYLYASANPVYYVDPTGLAPISTVDAGVEAELNNILKANSTLQIAELYRIAALEVAVPAVTYSLRGAIIRSILAFGVFGLAIATKGNSKKGSSPEVASKGGQQVERVGAKNDDYEDARGTIQIQGRDIAKDPPEYLSDGSLKSNPTLKYGASTSNGEGTVSWSWAQRVKKGECYPPASLALIQLDALKDAISKQQVQRRQKGFLEAADYITSSQLAGGAPAGPTKSFPKNEKDRDKKFPEARVDIKVYSGCAFHP